MMESPAEQNEATNMSAALPRRLNSMPLRPRDDLAIPLQWPLRIGCWRSSPSE
jgi:hypothetical protein